jgi:hypothetical protein
VGDSPTNNASAVVLRAAVSTRKERIELAIEIRDGREFRVTKLPSDRRLRPSNSKKRTLARNRMSKKIVQRYVRRSLNAPNVCGGCKRPLLPTPDGATVQTWEPGMDTSQTPQYGAALHNGYRWLCTECGDKRGIAAERKRLGDLSDGPRRSRNVASDRSLARLAETVNAR